MTTTYLLYSIYLITAIIIIIYDYKIQLIPILLLLCNYICLCFIINPILLIGIICILIAKQLNKPIDMLYICILIYLIIIVNNPYSMLSILILLIYTILQKSNKISYMFPLEIAIIIELLLKECFLL